MTRLHADERWHIAGSTARGFFSTALLIYGGSLFVSVVGSTSYAELMFIGLLASAAFYVFSLFISAAQGHRVYLGVVAAGLLFSCAVFMRQSPLLLYGFAAAGVVIDVIGANVVTAVVQENMSPVHFREFYLRVLYAEWIGRVLASVAIIMQQRLSPPLFYSLIWASAAIHLLCMGVVDRRLVFPKDARDAHRWAAVLDRTRRSFSYIFSNSLVKTALIALVWSRIAKVAVEAVYYQSVNARFPSAEAVSAFAAWTNIANLAATLAIPRQLLGAANRRLSLSTLLSALPVGVLLFAALPFVAVPFWPAVALMVFFQCVFRMMFFPAVRQCLLPVPAELSQSILSTFLLSTLLMSVAASGVMAGLKHYWLIPQFMIFLAVISLLMLYFLTGLDSYYIRNLWRHYASLKVPKAALENWSNELTSADLPDRRRYSPQEDEEDYALALPESFEDAGWPELIEWVRQENWTLPNRSALAKAWTRYAGRPHQEAVLIREIYDRSYDEDILKEAVLRHQAMLESKDPDDAHYGITLLQEIGAERFPEACARLARHADADIRRRARTLIRLCEAVRELPRDHCGGTAGRLLDRVLVRSIEEGGSDRFKGLLKRFLDRRDSSLIEDGLAALDHAGNKLRAVLLECLAAAGRGGVDFAPVVQDMYACGFEDAARHREALLALRSHADLGPLASILSERLDRLLDGHFQVRPRSGRKPAELDAFLHSLFLAQWLIMDDPQQRDLIETMKDFRTAGGRELAVLADMHLERLKSSARFSAWQQLMTPTREATHA